MSRGLLTDETLNSIHSRIESLDDLRSAALSLAPDFIAMKFLPPSDVPVAAVCFQDCTDTLMQIRYAIFEHFAHGNYYREVSQPPNVTTATFFERYYLDDAVFRLYAAAEDVANTVLFMLGVTDAQLAPYRKTNRISQQAVTAAFLKKEHATWNLTRDLIAMGTSADWQFVMSYRNRWVHEQPPTISGLGVQYRRRSPWVVSADGTKRFLAIGSGDEAEYDIDSLRQTVMVTFSGLIRAVRAALSEYLVILEKHGIMQGEAR